MKSKLDIRYTLIVIVAVCIVLILGKFLINYGYENDFIHHLPTTDNLDEGTYGLLINLYQTRLNIGNWIVAVIGATLTFIAFYVQYEYNSNQKEDLVQERYENKLFHMLDVYRDICKNTSITNVGQGKIAYHYMFYEYKAIFNILKTEESIFKEIRYKDDSTINYIAFTYFINGVSEDGLDTTIDEEILSKAGKEEIKKILLSHRENSEKLSNAKRDPGVKYLRDYRNKNITLFDGHRFRFMPYIKYVSLIVEFMASSKCSETNYAEFLSKEQTEHEIGLIYAYHGYINYKANNSNNHQSLWNKIYEDIPEQMRYKFRYNGENRNTFLS